MEKNSVEIEELKYFGVKCRRSREIRPCLAWFCTVLKKKKKKKKLNPCLKMEKNSVEIEELKCFGGGNAGAAERFGRVWPGFAS